MMELTSTLSSFVPKFFSLKKFPIFSPKKPALKKFLKISQKAPNFLEKETPKKFLYFWKRNLLIFWERHI